MAGQRNAARSSCVVLLHGLCRTWRSMEPLRELLEKSGYIVCNVGYPSRSFSIVELADQVRAKIEEVAEDYDCIHFVTHSMGGIILRQIQATRPINRIGRTVMLAPPNRGSHVVDKIGQWLPFRLVNGPAGGELGTSIESKPVELGPVSFEVGVIAGDRSLNWILSLMLPSPNDGKVAVSHTSVDGQRAFRVVHASHPLIIKNREAQENALAFLQTGNFLET